MHEICFEELIYDFFNNISQKYDLILELFKNQIKINSLKCDNWHFLEPIIGKIFRMYINKFLKRVSQFKNEYKTIKNIRKFLIFNPDYDESELL